MDFWRLPFFSRLPVCALTFPCLPPFTLPLSFPSPFTFLSFPFVVSFTALLLNFPSLLSLFSLSFFLSFHYLIFYFSFLCLPVFPPSPFILYLFLASAVSCFLPFLPFSVFSSLCSTTFNKAAFGNLNGEFTACEFNAWLILDVTPPDCNSEV